LDFIKTFGGVGDKYNARFVSSGLQLKYVLNGFESLLQDFDIKIQEV
jgi:hypothetical protein